MKYLLIVLIVLGFSGFNSWGYVVSDSYTIPLDKAVEARTYVHDCTVKLRATSPDPMLTITRVCSDEAAIIYGKHVYRVMTDNILGPKKVLHTTTSIESVNNFLDI